MPVTVKVQGQQQVKGEGDKAEGGEIKEDVEAEEVVVVAVLDVDCSVENGFDEVDEDWLGRLAALLARCCDWDIDITTGGEKVSGIS